MTVTLILTGGDVYDFTDFSILSLVLVSTEMYHIETVFDYIPKHLEVEHKYSAARRILNSLFVVLEM